MTPQATDLAFGMAMSCTTIEASAPGRGGEQVVERGAHPELLDGGGVYAELYELQYRGQELRVNIYEWTRFSSGMSWEGPCRE